MEHDFPAKLFPADARQFFRHPSNLIIRYRDQNYTRRYDLPRHPSVRLPRPHQTNCAPRARLAASNDCVDFPTQFAQTPPQRPSHAARSDDGEAIFHPVLA